MDQLAQTRAEMAIVTPQRVWRPVSRQLITSTEALADASGYAHLIEWPPQDPAHGFVLTPPLDPHTQINFKFLVADAPGADGEVALWAYQEVRDDHLVEYVGDLVAKITVTAGAAIVHPSSHILPASDMAGPPPRGSHANTLWADTIEIDANHALNEAAQVHADAAGGAAVLTLDSVGSVRWGLQFRRGTASGLNALYRLM